MSSPTVLTFAPSTLQEARCTNSRQAAMYLELAQTLLEQTGAKAAALRAKGTFVPDPHVGLEHARATVTALLQTGDASEGLKYAHAYWQSLKHPWTDLVESLDANDSAEAEIARLRDDLAERTRVAEIAERLALRCGVLPAVRRLETAAGTSVDELIAQRLAAIVETALAADPSRDVDVLGAQLNTALAGIAFGEQKLAVLDGLRVRMQDELIAVKRAKARERIAAEQARRVHEDLRVQLRAIATELEPLAEAEEQRYLAEIDAIRAALGTLPDDRLELRVSALRDDVMAARGRKSVHDLVVKTLRRQGYDEIETGVSEALGPDAIRRRFFRRHGDDDRVVEFAHGADDALSVETVRVTEASIEARQADREAQQELCRVMKRVTDAMEESWKAVIVHQGAVGEPMAVRKDLVAGRNRVPTRPAAAARERAS